MDGENHGKPYFLMEDLGGKPTYFWKHPNNTPVWSMWSIFDGREVTTVKGSEFSEGNPGAQNGRNIQVTPLKFNMEPEKKSLEKVIPFGNHHFQVPC